ncbi:MAG: hypothetical protein HY722_14400 [Planctomycetes bacterium]|nr:hypothetical protein [Planctomycetota bacterium]
MAPKGVARGAARSGAFFVVACDRAFLEALSLELGGLPSVGGPRTLLNLREQKGVETYGRDVYYLHCPCEGGAMGEVFLWLAARQVQAEMVVHPGRNFQIPADLRGMGKPTRKLIHHCTNIVKDEFLRALAPYPEFQAFRHRYKREVSRANQMLLALKTALSGAPDAPPAPQAATVDGVRDLVREARSAFEALVGGGRVPAEAVAAWTERLLRLEERHRRLAARMEQMGHERRKEQARDPGD